MRHEHVAPRQLALFGSDGPMLDAERFATGQRMRPGDDVSGAEDVGVIDSGERGVAFEAGVQPQAAAVEPFRVRDRAEADHHDVGGDAFAVAELYRLDVAIA